MDPTSHNNAAISSDCVARLPKDSSMRDLIFDLERSGIGSSSGSGDSSFETGEVVFEIEDETEAVVIAGEVSELGK